MGLQYLAICVCQILTLNLKNHLYNAQSLTIVPAFYIHHRLGMLFSNRKKNRKSLRRPKSLAGYSPGTNTDPASSGHGKVRLRRLGCVMPFE